MKALWTAVLRNGSPSRRNVRGQGTDRATPAPTPMKTRIPLFRIAVCAALLNFSVPGGALVSFGVPLREGVRKSLAARENAQHELAARRAKSRSRLLSSQEERTMQGRAGENPYLAGQRKWDVVYKGLNIVTGNYSMSATDLSFDGGYGIPVNVTRSYSANNPDEGPFGKGWTLSADVRSTAGGLLKSGSAPVRSVPFQIKERPSAQDDPNVAVEPAAAVTVTDAGGTEETVQKDVDGILTTPAWDKNVYDSQYEWVTLNGGRYQVLLSNTVKTPEGTVYTYAKRGSFPNGTRPWNDPNATPEAANVLKVTSATDRQGNVTTYTYSTGFSTYGKSNGTVAENRLTRVAMPGGHVIRLNWGANPQLASFDRVTSVDDDLGGRTVTYAYVGAAGHGLLASATSPGGKTTSYGYGSASNDSNDDYSNIFPAISGTNIGPVPNDLLTSITDARGLTTTIDYLVANHEIMPTMGENWVPCMTTRKITQPNGTVLLFGAGSVYQVRYGYSLYKVAPAFIELTSGTNPVLINSGTITMFYQPYDTSIVNAEFGPAYLASTIDTGYWNYAGSWTRSYGAADQNLIRETRHSLPSGYVDDRVRNSANVSLYVGAYDRWLVGSRGLSRYDMGGQANSYSAVVSETSYNFLGAPLRRTSSETTISLMGSSTTQRTTTVDYAYWGADRYFQQKAVRDGAGRYSFTDYYPNTAPAGKRGQTYRVYDPKNAGFTLNTGIPVPPATAPGNVWKYQLEPSSPTAYAAQFDYDAQGRPTDVWKLQRTTPSWGYVRTHTTYGGDGAPHWGQASSVVEDSGGINRTTQTLAYTPWGKASKVQDAKGQVFETDFDPDGQVNSVVRKDVNPNVTVVSYAYGSSGLENGQPVSVTDGLSGVTQSIAYTPSGGGLGMPASVTETNGADSYSTSYGYTAAGDRATATYATPQGTTRWGYSDYVSVGDPTSGSRAFQTLCRLDASGARTPEEMHYVYGLGGQLQEATFAQTPYVDPSTGPYVPSGGASYYDAAHPASRRARAHYEYDAGGRLKLVSHWWDVWNGSGYASQAVLANECDYETSGLNRGLKTASRFYKPSASDPTQFALERTETYGYDPQLDYLTSASYGDGLPNASASWSYDAAGNRNDAVCDNLNRATSLGGEAVTSDILGNRTTRGQIGQNNRTYLWDCLNRMTHHVLNTGSAIPVTEYLYRADGMRVAKATSTGTTTRYRHDGQMGMEDQETQGASTTVTRYGLGARGVDLIERTSGGAVTTGFPLYDAHGNNVATLSRSGTGYAVNDRRSYDAWGVVRAQQSGGDPKLRYCASLGHRQDDESGLIYMRARYYEPTSGRFVSEDPAGAGRNWFAYCAGDPVNSADRTGKSLFTIGDYTIRIDFDLNPQWGDLHVYEKGKEIISMFGDGAVHHVKAPNVFTKDFIKTLVRAATSGDKNAAHLYNCLKDGLFGFDMSDVFKNGGLAIIAYTSVDAYFQQDPMGFMDIMETAFTGGRASA